ncbi:MAG TPA: alpha/beta hydrolase [Candidatus Binataceae bacterium]|nr:alpha/beta hydrolase [Candidatus Binataceae bacterium]
MVKQVELRGAEGLRLVADAFGPIDGPPALLLHGLGQTRQSWGLAAEKLGGQGWRAYAVDQRGHGDSDRSPAGAYAHADVAADVLALCEAVKRPPLVIGASMGGVAALVAQGTSDVQLYRGLVLVDITPDIDVEGARRIIAFMSVNPDGYVDLEEAAEAISAYRGPERGKASPRGLARVLRQGDDGRWRWHWDPRVLDARKGWAENPKAAEAYLERMRTGMTAGVHKLAVPTMLVRGGSSDVVTREAAEALLQLIPHAKFVDVADASHMVAGDRNDIFSAAVLEFALPLLDVSG